MPKITTIPATKTLHTKTQDAAMRARRVAGYARVSTGSEDQANSYSSQVDYYTSYIASRLDWQLVDIYTDEGISGTSTAKRAGFKTMIADALNGNIDLIITKSVSRFARNTVDSLTAVRQLKENGVEVYFEKENIWTFDAKGELLITIMSSLAQEESRSISENVTWGHRKRFADGKALIPFSSMLGFKRNEDGTIGIDEQQANIVRHIYHLYLTGSSIPQIAVQLDKDGVPTPRGGKRWRHSTIRSILTNEKYKGDALLQKTFTTDFLTKTKKPNQGEVPQYYVTGSHEAIIDPDTWQLAQAKIQANTANGRADHLFSGTIICSHCGGIYGAKTWHSTSKYRRTIWQCNHKYTRPHPKNMPTLSTATLEQTINQAITRLARKRKTTSHNQMHAQLADTSRLQAQLEELTNKLEVINGLIEHTLTSTNPMQPQATSMKLAELETRYQQTLDARKQTLTQIEQRKTRAAKLRVFHKLLTQNNIQYAPETIHALVERIEVYPDGKVTVIFKDGSSC